MNSQPIPTRSVTSLPEFVEFVARDAQGWEPAFPWFRGEPRICTSPLTPMVFRTPLNAGEPAREAFHYDENNLLQTFRRRAHLMGLPIVPQTPETDKWLFLARHVGLPTRLLDWTEGALIGLYFALLCRESVVWMLNPCELNRRSAADALPNVFPLTWHQEPGAINLGFANIQAAWRLGEGALECPVAIEPTNIHPRMNAQHSYFTVHGKTKSPLSDQVDGSCLKKYDINFSDRDAAIRDLRRLGIAHSTIMPDAEALAVELSRFLVVPN